ncbi:MAG: PAS domain S-box protein [Bacteroidales bacterium]|nr:PAS domain S-box protein [Bacteroidales bacterium]
MKSMRHGMKRILIFGSIAILSICYITFTWIRKEDEERGLILKLAQSIGSTLPIDDIKSLNAVESDLNKPQYNKVKEILVRIREVNPEARFAYIYSLRNNKIYFIADSEPPTSPDYSPPGEEYAEAGDLDKQPFLSGKPLLQRAVTDRWGRWISISIPIIDKSNNHVIAVFGLDYNAHSWTSAIIAEILQSSILALLLSLVLVFLIRIRNKNKQLKSEAIDRNVTLLMLRESEMKFHSMFLSHAAVMLLIDPSTGQIIEANKSAEDFYGYSKEVLLKMHISDINISAKEELQEDMKRATELKTNLFIFKHRLSTGEDRFVEVHSTPINQEGQMLLFSIIHDISDRMAMELKLQRNTEFQRSLLENIAVGIVLIDPDTLVVENANVFGLALIGDRKENIEGIHCHKIFCNRESSNYEECTKESLAGNSESILVRKDNTTIPILRTVKEIMVDGKEKLLVSFVDITAQKTAEEEFLQSSKKWEAIISASPDGIGITSLDGKLIYMSGKLVEMFGYAIEEKDFYINKSIFEFIDPSDHELLKKNIGKLYTGENENKITEYKVIRKDQSRFYVDVNSTILLDSDGKPTSILFIERDITERKKAEEELHNERSLLRTIIDLLPDAVYVKDKETRKILANAKEVGLSGKDTEVELLGKTDRELYPEKEWKKAKEEDDYVLQKGESILNIEGHITDNLGNIHWMMGAKVPLRDIHGEIIGLVGVSHDITDRKIAEEKRKESEHNFRTFFESMDDMIMVADITGRPIFTNAAFINKLGYTQEELHEKNVIDIRPAEKREEAEQTFRAIFAGTENSCSLPLVKKNGQHIPVETTIWFGKWNGEDCIFGVSKDLSVEQAALHKFNTIFNNSPALMLLATAPDGTITEVNEAFLEKTGFDRVEIIDQKIQELNIFSDSDQREIIANELQKSGKILNLEVDIKTKNNHSINGIFSNEVIESGGNQFHLSVMTDITQRKKAEDALLQQTELQNILVRMASVFINLPIEEVDITISESLKEIGEFVDADRSYLFNYDFENRTISNEYEWCNEGITPQIDSLQNFSIDTIQDWVETHSAGNILYIEDTSKMEDSPEKENLLSQEIKSLITIPMLSSGKCIGFIGFDSVKSTRVYTDKEIIFFRLFAHLIVNVKTRIGADKKLIETNSYLESATQKATEMATEAERANKSKSLFLANMSHEIRTPLNAIIGFSQLLNREKLLTETQKEYNNSIINAGEHLLKLINDILELSKVEAGRMQLVSNNIDLLAFLDNVEQLFKEPAQAKHLSLLFTKSTDLPQFVVVDETKLRQIFVNLISNAIKFTEKGEISVIINSKKISKESFELCVDVKDTGLGIPKEEQDRLFRHFEQTNSGMNKGSGTGLGLALSRQLALLMNGDIKVDSELGKGATFSFCVTIKKGSKDQIVDISKKRVLHIEENHRIYKILIVDDREENLRVAQNLLQLIGFETNTAINGEIAINVFKKWNPDLILMDIRMPIMDGYTASRIIKTMPNGLATPIIALTASTFEEDKDSIDKAGISGYIHKPFRENELFGKIAQTLGINYIYEDDSSLMETKLVSDNIILSDEISKLPEVLIQEMQEALSAADFDLLLELINNIEPQFPNIANQLKIHTTNYDYAFLHSILNSDI